MPQTSVLPGKFVNTLPRWYGRHQRTLDVLLQHVLRFNELVGAGLWCATMAQQEIM